MKKKTIVLFLLFFLAGLSLLLYPAVSNYWNSVHATQAVTSYRDAAKSLSDAQFTELLSAAEAYNTALAEKKQSYFLTDEQKQTYLDTLNLEGNGVMGYIEIPAIDVVLPIYHGTEEAVLQTSAGHLEWTSLPVGGDSTHCVLSGHRGLPSAKLFTDLDKLTPGDTFLVTVLNRTLTYEVDSIETVEPAQVNDLEIQAGKDLCTLVTCTPYGINTHRMLVHGHRVENAKASARITSEVVQIEPLIVMPFVAIPLMLAAFWLMSRFDKKQDEGADIYEENPK